MGTVKLNASNKRRYLLCLRMIAAAAGCLDSVEELDGSLMNHGQYPVKVEARR